MRFCWRPEDQHRGIISDRAVLELQEGWEVDDLGFEFVDLGRGLASARSS
jgi:hypothetical protein